MHNNKNLVDDFFETNEESSNYSEIESEHNANSLALDKITKQEKRKLFTDSFNNSNEQRPVTKNSNKKTGPIENVNGYIANKITALSSSVKQEIQKFKRFNFITFGLHLEYLKLSSFLIIKNFSTKHNRMFRFQDSITSYMNKYVTDQAEILNQEGISSFFKGSIQRSFNRINSSKNKIL